MIPTRTPAPLEDQARAPQGAHGVSIPEPARRPAPPALVPSAPAQQPARVPEQRAPSHASRAHDRRTGVGVGGWPSPAMPWSTRRLPSAEARCCSCCSRARGVYRLDGDCGGNAAKGRGCCTWEAGRQYAGSCRPPTAGEEGGAWAVRLVERRGPLASGIEGCFPVPGHGWNGACGAGKHECSAREEVAACTWTTAWWDASVHGDADGSGGGVAT